MLSLTILRIASDRSQHLADRLRPLPADVTLMDAWDQRQPFGPRLTTAPGSDHACCRIISCRDTSLTIGVGAAVDRVLDHPVDGRIVRPAPDHVAIMALGGQVQPMLDEPEQGLPDTAEFGDLVGDEDDGLLDPAIGILLAPVADLHETDPARRRAPEIVIDRFDARPAQRRQTIAHRILQGAALAIVENLMGGGLPYIQDRLALQMVRPDLLRHHDASPPVPERGRRRRDRRSGGPSASSAYGASRRATPAIAPSAPRRRAGRRTDRTDVHCCEDDGER